MAMILLKLHNFAEAYFGQKIQDAIISCPAYLESSQRDPIRYAGRLAGFRLLLTLNDHTAAGDISLYILTINIMLCI